MAFAAPSATTLLQQCAAAKRRRLLHSAGRCVAPLDARPLQDPQFSCKAIRGIHRIISDKSSRNPDLGGRRREAAAPTSAAYISRGDVRHSPRHPQQRSYNSAPPRSGGACSIRQADASRRLTPVLNSTPHFACREFYGYRRTLRDTAGGNPDLPGSRREAAEPAPFGRSHRRAS